MKEKDLSMKRIINKLGKRHYLEICPICDGCACDIIYEVLQYFPNANFNFLQVEDRLYTLRISV